MKLPLRVLLRPLTPVYSAAVRLRAYSYGHGVFKSTQAPLPLISVGNLSFGGTGKTPLVEALVRDLVKRGHSPAILSRGYGRRQTEPLILSGPETGFSPEEAGDEPLELASRLPGIPILVDACRVRSALRAPGLGADCLILDDGFQHLKIKRDLNILLIDAGDPWAGSRLPPRGRLREPLSAMRRADVIIVTKIIGERIPEDIVDRIAGIHPGCPLLGARIETLRILGPNGPESPETMKGRDVMALAAIGRPGAFLRSLGEIGAVVREEHFFPDHHPYSQEEIEALLAKADAENFLLVTTAKDAVKLPKHPLIRVLEIRMAPLEKDWSNLWKLLPVLSS